MTLTTRNITHKILNKFSRFGVGCCNHDSRELQNIKKSLFLYGTLSAVSLGGIAMNFE